MDIDTAALEEVLRVLRDNGVTRFSTTGFTVEFVPPAPEVREERRADPVTPPQPEHPRVTPSSAYDKMFGGNPPKFPAPKTTPGG